MIDLEKFFTRKHYAEFKRAVENREDYDFRHAKTDTFLPHPSTGVFFSISGRACDNGVWKDNYLYGIDTWRGNGGTGRPFDPVDVGVLTYDELVAILYEGLGLKPSQRKQITFFDLEMF